MSWLRARQSDSQIRRWAIVALALAASIGLYFLGSAVLIQGTAARAEIVAPAHAAALVAATTGDQSAEVQAVGEKAKVINASMPFSQAPVQAARAFIIPAGESLDQRRALLCLTQAVYYEAGYEPLEGRRAVAQVVLNRLRHPAFPKSVCGVVYQRNSTPVCQFTFVCDGSLDRRPEAGAWRQAEAVARAALAGYVETAVGEATHYHADYVAPRWAPMLTKISQLGAHIFYRWPGSWGQAGAFNGRYIGEPRDPATMRPLILPRVQGQDLNVGDGAVAYAGPPIARAPNDVGGLLDTSKGWTLNIPMPSEAGAASKAIADQQQRQQSKMADAPQNGAPSETRVIASR
jgi:spore germination cell wall hydrolase CwlJ-like protein